MDTVLNPVLNFPFCDDITKYEKLMKVGQGTFGEVYKARHRKTNVLVALKKVLLENEREGFPITALREIRILQQVHHENIVNLIEVCHTKPTNFNRQRGTCFLVFEFCEHDLAGLLTQVRFSLSEIKKIMQMLCNALYFLHFNRILHRDMKTANILVTKDGVLKLTDFGLARALSMYAESAKMRYTNRVVTLWYRPPELLLGERTYGPAIDMWGAGCIMGELWTRNPIMQGTTEQQQLHLISNLCGSINPEVWPGVDTLEYYTKMELRQNQKRSVQERLRNVIKDSLALDLIDNLLALDPAKRFDADTTLNHDFFWSDPMPASLGKTLSRLNFSLFELMTVRCKKENRPGPANRPSNHLAQQSTSSTLFDRVF